jgi:hypothetical protein
MITRAHLPARVAFVAVARAAWLPALGALALALAAARAGRVTAAAGASASGPLVLWLHLPCAVLAAVTVLHTLAAWPMFGRERQGAAFVRRLSRTLLDGCGSALLGGVAAGALWLIAAGVAFALALSHLVALEPPRAWSRLAAPQGASVLDARTPALTLHGPAVLADAVRINPLVLYTGSSLAPVALTVRVDGDAVGECLVRGNGEQAVMSLPAPRLVHSVTLTRPSAASLTLVFPAGSIEVRHTAEVSLAANLGLAAATYAVPAALALLLACVGRRQLTAPALSIVALAALAILALAELTPGHAALTAGARARAVAASQLPWAPSGVLATALWALAVAAGSCRRRARRTA